MSNPPHQLERRLTLHQLRVLKAVVEERGFTRAAQRLSLSQPGVTHQMQSLARAVGQPLFHGGRRDIELTEVGTAIYERAGRILALVAETGEVVDDLNGVRRGSVRIAGDTTVGIYVLPDALASFQREHPGVGLRLDVVNRTAVRAHLLGGEADLGVVGRLWEDDLLAGEPFLENELRCFSSPAHALARRARLEPAELLEGPLLLREPGSGTRESTEAILREHGVDPVPGMEMASNGALKRAVARGLGVTVLSIHAVRLELALGLLRPLDVDGFPVRRTWHIVSSTERLLSPAAQSFRRHLLDTGWRSSLAIPLASE